MICMVMVSASASEFINKKCFSKLRLQLQQNLRSKSSITSSTYKNDRSVPKCCVVLVTHGHYYKQVSPITSPFVPRSF